ncbi:Uncharacterized protein FKW44_003727 [Caligus rogercresseyi]|uniref:Uncharacterized protein n=1 Tax=Caligus rogercresseyi TaxID=217165 RepID=A0A7T8QX57_CALRO|nr:Uncharacterized protein FKW44_003727 [Caligus rogercresseyi]
MEQHYEITSCTHFCCIRDESGLRGIIRAYDPPHLVPRLKSDAFITELRTKLLPLVAANFPEGNVVFKQDWAPAHTSKATQEFPLGQHPFLTKVILAPIFTRRKFPRLHLLGARGKEGLQGAPPQRQDPEGLSQQALARHE